MLNIVQIAIILVGNLPKKRRFGILWLLIFGDLNLVGSGIRLLQDILVERRSLDQQRMICVYRHQSDFE